MYGPQISQMCQRTKPFCVIKDAMQQDRFFLLCLGISFSTILVLLQFHSSAITSFNSKTYYICAFEGAYNLIKFKNDPYFHSWMKWIIFLPFFENFCCVVCFYLPLLSIYFFLFLYWTNIMCFLPWSSIERCCFSDHLYKENRSANVTWFTTMSWILKPKFTKLCTRRSMHLVC